MTAISIQEHVPLRDKTTLKIGGTARYFVSVASVEKLKEAVAFAWERHLPVIVLGGGSNVLIHDAEIDGVVVKIDIRGVEWSSRGTEAERGQHARPDEPPFGRGTDTELAVAGAGENWDELAAEAVRRGLWGIENLSGIPGTVGAAPIQNIGAYGTEMRDVLEWVEVFDTKSGEVRQLANAECSLEYRDSVFKQKEGKSLIVTRVALRLSKNGRPNLVYKDMQAHFAGRSNPSLSEIRQAVLEIRSKKFPNLRECGTAGSFFKNPIISQEQFTELKKRYPDLPGFEFKVNSQKSMVKLPLAWILDNICGLKGYRKGNVALFERQPIVLVNTGNATAGEIKNFAEDVTRRVKEATGISIEYEVQELT